MDGQSGTTGIQAAILKVMAEVGVIGKTRTNTGQNYQFRGIDDVVERVSPLLVKHGITCIPTNIRNYRVSQIETKKGHAMHVTCEVEHTYEASDGSKRIAVTLGEAMDSGDKASNKAMSGALKYAHCEVFEIPTFGKDADTESQSPEVAPRTQSGKPPTTAAATKPPARPAGGQKSAPRPNQGASGAVFPNYGNAKGKPVAGAAVKDLEFYRGGCLRSLDDPSKANWHAKEQALLSAIDDELSRHGQGTGGNNAYGGAPDEPPPPGDEDAPF